MVSVVRFFLPANQKWSTSNKKTLQNFRLLRIIFKDLMAYNTEIDEKNDQ